MRKWFRYHKQTRTGSNRIDHSRATLTAAPKNGTHPSLKSDLMSPHYHHELEIGHKEADHSSKLLEDTGLDFPKSDSNKNTQVTKEGGHHRRHHRLSLNFP